MFGADTDVGKTIFSTGLAIASAVVPEGGGDAEHARVAYLKPVSTGAASDADEAHLHTYAPHVQARTLVQFTEPVSPHVAARQHDGRLPASATDAALVQGIGTWLQESAAANATAAILETAGGVHSPAPSGISQADLLRPLRLPVVLVGSSMLGGISTTRASLEALRMRGYDVDAVLLFPSGQLGNETYLESLLRKELKIPVFALGGPNGAGWGGPPPRAPTHDEEVAQMQAYYTGLVHGRDDRGLLGVVDHLRACHAQRVHELDTLGERTHRQCWWPFTQHRRYTPEDVMVIDSAHGDFFATYEKRGGTDTRLFPTLDGSASWWTQCVGHAHPRLTAAAAHAAGRYGHVLFPGAANAPALALTERLLGTTPLSFPAPGAWASRVFISDDGSTAMEVALKMAMEAAARRYAPQPISATNHARAAAGRRPGSLAGRPPREWSVLGLQGSYHGDTIGAMDACEPSIYSEHVPWYKGRGYWLAPPTLRMRQGKVEVHGEDTDPLATFATLSDVYSVAERMENDPLAKRYTEMLNDTLERLVREEQYRFGALVLEPMVMGAGGMVFVDPLYQRCLIDVVRAREDLFGMTDPPLRRAAAPGPSEPGAWRGLPVIFDEIFTGLFRLGYASADQVLGTTPDIACYAKILSGGLVPLSVTLATSSIFDVFASSTEKQHALLHGHSYTAHPIGCAVAAETLDMLSEMVDEKVWAAHQDAWGSAWSMWDRAFVEQLSHTPGIDSVMALGTVMKLTLPDTAAGYASNVSDHLVQSLRKAGAEAGACDVHLRTLGNVVYIMCSLTTPPDVLAQVQKALETHFR